MRHKKNYRKLGRTTKHYAMLGRSIINSLFQHERIVTTVAKAKEFKGDAERLITLARNNSLHHFRQALDYLQNESVTKKLFNEIAPRFKDRPGGYTRLLKLGGSRWAEEGKSKWVMNRLGDNGPRAILELVVRAEKEQPKGKKGKTKTEKAQAAKAPVAKTQVAKTQTAKTT